MKKILQNLPTNPIIKSENWRHINKLPLADPEYNIPSNIDILLGGDIWGDIVQTGLRLSKNGSPIAQRTRLRWILKGTILQPTVQSNTRLSCLTTITEFDESINEQLQQFWLIEEIGEEKASTDEEEKCEKYYKETTIRNASGKYTVKMPFSNEFPVLGRSRNIAIAQLIGMERKYRKNPDLKLRYVENIQEYFENNHIEEVFTNENEHRKIINGIETYTCAYLPHHAVIKTSSSTTKCRIVYDASTPTTYGKKLNEQLLTGPTIQDDIITILTRWRNCKFVFTGDISRMYRHITRRNEYISKSPMKI